VLIIRILLLAALPLAALAQINVSGNVSGTWGEDNWDYRVIGDITVPTGEILTILDSVQVRFMEHYDFTVRGALQVEGTLEDSVIFVYHYGTAQGAWGGIEFDEAISGLTELNYCLIESGERAANVNNCSVTFNNCLMRHTSLSPIRGSDSQITMSHSAIMLSNGSGFSLQDSDINLTECEISYHDGVNGRGISASAGSSITMTGGYIGHNAGEGIHGLLLNNVYLTDVEIADNGDDGINLTSSGELEGYRLLVHDNGGHGIFLSSTALDASNLTISMNEGNGINAANTSVMLSSSIMDRNDQWGLYLQSGNGFASYNCTYENISGDYFNVNPGIGSIEEDPQYESITMRDYNLQETSPCIDTGSPWDPLDPDSTITDMGAIYYDQTAVLPWENPATIKDLRIADAYPNPFNPTLNLIIEANRPAIASIEVWSAQGRRIARIWSGLLRPGLNRTSWHAHDVPSGHYVIQLETGGTVDTYPCVLVK
jgi:hypothetical protein